MTDFEILAADAVRALGVLGLAALIALNAGGLAIAVLAGGGTGVALAFLWGCAIGLIGVLISYLIATCLQIGIGLETPLGVMIGIQIVAPLLSFGLFVIAAVNAIHSLT